MSHRELGGFELGIHAGMGAIRVQTLALVRQRVRDPPKGSECASSASEGKPPHARKFEPGGELPLAPTN